MPAHTELQLSAAGGHPGIAYWQGLDTPAILLNLCPFIVLLFLIALLPLSPAQHWWEHNRHKLLVAGLCGLVGLGCYLIPTGDWHRVLHTAFEYFSFMALLTALFTVSGGIHISGAFAGLPRTNTLIMAFGAILANFAGTTGASMLLIRPLMVANHTRKHTVHIFVFFIFIVANCGGLLTPLGDPPLYLGFLRGVPFNWTLRLLPHWLVTVGSLLFIFYLLDSRRYARESLECRADLQARAATRMDGRKFKLEGHFNLSLLLAIILTILISGTLITPTLVRGLGPENGDLAAKSFQIVALSLIAWLSWRRTPTEIHNKNQFNFEPVQEVACLFVGIFAAMLPALSLLEAKGTALALSVPWQYFWIAGGLSGFLDNAPTYVTFATLAAVKSGLSPDQLQSLAALKPELLAAVSCGSVLMGALSYIGNGPNFMVKAMVEKARFRMPGFGGYLIWSTRYLLPVFGGVTLLFFLNPP